MFMLQQESLSLITRGLIVGGGFGLVVVSQSSHIVYPGPLVEGVAGLWYVHHMPRIVGCSRLQPEFLPLSAVETYTSAYIGDAKDSTRRTEKHL